MSTGLQDVVESRRRLFTLIDKATKTGETFLDPDFLKEIKALVRRGDEFARASCEHAFEKLATKHSQIRYLTVLLMHELFTRSKPFRSALVQEFRTFIDSTIGVHIERPLPPPEFAAVMLREKSLEVIEKWHDDYAPHYPQLKLGYKYLKDNLKMRFPEIQATAASRRHDEQEQAERTQRLLGAKYDQLLRETSEQVSDIRENLHQLNGCLRILMGGPPGADDGTAVRTDLEAPSPRASTSRSEDDAEDMAADDEPLLAVCEEDLAEWGTRRLPVSHSAPTGSELPMHGAGVATRMFQIDITIADEDLVTEESRDNAPVFDSARECFRLLSTKHLPLVSDWLDTLTRVAINASEAQRREQIIGELIELRRTMFNAQARCSELGIGMPRAEDPQGSDLSDPAGDDVEWTGLTVVSSDPSQSGSTSESAAATVPMPRAPATASRSHTTSCSRKGASASALSQTCTTESPKPETVPATKRAASQSNKVDGEELDEEACQAGDDEVEQRETREELLRRAPLVPASSAVLDLWTDGEGSTRAPVLANNRGLDIGGHWGAWDVAKEVDPSRVASDRTTVTAYYPIVVEPVAHACRALLRDGRLCERRDRVHCPFHGRIVPRDEHGLSLGPPNPSVNADTGAATGGARVEGSRGSRQVAQETRDEQWMRRDVDAQKKRKSKLVDVTRKQDTAKNRLLRKLESERRSTVAEEMRLEETKRRDRSANRW